LPAHRFSGSFIEAVNATFKDGLDHIYKADALVGNL
jgi:hypothetical protein